MQACCRAPHASSRWSAPTSLTTSSSRLIGGCSSLEAERAPVRSPPPRRHASHSTYASYATYATCATYATHATCATYSLYLLILILNILHLLYLRYSPYSPYSAYSAYSAYSLYATLLTLPYLLYRPACGHANPELTLPLPLTPTLPLTTGMFLHADTLRTSSWQMQVRGRKRWHLCPGPGGVQAAILAIQSYEP